MNDSDYITMSFCECLGLYLDSYFRGVPLDFNCLSFYHLSILLDIIKRIRLITQNPDRSSISCH